MSSTSSKLHQLTVGFNDGTSKMFIYESFNSIQTYQLSFNLKEEANGILASFDGYGLGLRWKDITWYEVKIME